MIQEKWLEILIEHHEQYIARQGNNTPQHISKRAKDNTDNNQKQHNKTGRINKNTLKYMRPCEQLTETTNETKEDIQTTQTTCAYKATMQGKQHH